MQEKVMGSMICKQAFILIFALAIVGAPNPTSARGTPTSSYEGETSPIEITLTMSGSQTALKIDEEVCQFGFPLLVEQPVLIVYDESGTKVSETTLGNGDRALVGESYSCSQEYTVDVPGDRSFRIDIAPYYTEEFSQEDVNHGALRITIVRGDNEPFPISPIPAGGPIEGTDDIRLVGTFELRGEAFDDYMSSPITGCMGMGGYSDIAAGMQITIKDETGTIIGVASLVPDPLSNMLEECKFYFVAEVPESSFYTFESGRRGSLTYSHEELEESGWTVTLGIG